MMDENGKVLTEKEIIKATLDHLADALCLIFETESLAGNSLAFMIDSAIKYGQVVYRDDDILSASSDYSAYEHEVYLREKKHIKVVK